jgi:GDP-4-dehydro-6-deoxy-D-mannose reductase
VRIVVTGATGFVGRWLMRELEATGHEAIGTPASSVLDISDSDAVGAFVGGVRPEAVVHLAGMSYGPDARADPDRAMAVNAVGTRNLMRAVHDLAGSVPVLVASSSEVYGNPDQSDLPLRESAPLRTDQPYGLSKLAQEQTTFEAAEAFGIPVIIARAFNHTGPGQRPDFVVPALAARIVAAQKDGHHVIRAGNVDVRRDIGDVRDVVRAYRLLIEGVATTRLPRDQFVYNVATGKPVAIREVIDRLGALAGIDVDIEIDPALVRTDDAPEICGDASRLSAAVGWHPSIELDETLADILRDASSPTPLATSSPARHPPRAPAR